MTACSRYSSSASPRRIPDTTWMRRAGDETFRYMESFFAVGVIYVMLAQTINIGRILTGRLLLSKAPVGQRR